MNLKKHITTVFAIVALFSLGACEKVIDLKLDETVPLIVIDGGISDQNEYHRVKVSQTYSFTEPNKFNGLSGAKVVLKIDGAAQEIVFREVAPGVYESPTKFKGKSGSSYELTVSYEGKTYQAVSVMPVRVALDSLTFKTFNFFGDNKSYIVANFLDPAGISNQYRYILRVKTVVEEDAVSEDRFNDGNKVANVIFYELDDLVKGDSILVEFQCIDRNVYRYLYSLGQNSGQGGPPVAPANPPTNFNNGALGIFNAYTSSKRTAVIK